MLEKSWQLYSIKKVSVFTYRVAGSGTMPKMFPLSFFFNFLVHVEMTANFRANIFDRTVGIRATDFAL